MTKEHGYFIFDYGYHAAVWSVEETPLDSLPVTEDTKWFYVTGRDEKTVYAVKRDLYNTEEQGYSEAHAWASLHCDMGDYAVIHHMNTL